MSLAVSANMIRLALEKTYTSPEWYLGFEVGNSTGTDCKRHADAIAINAYPSKGFEVRGFEIKVSKQDLSAELKNGIKSDEIARFCDYWFLVVPKGLSDGFTLPPTWGVIEYSDGKLRQKVKAQRLDKIQPTVGFLCAMMRGRERLVCSMASKVADTEKEKIKREAVWNLKNAEKELESLREKLCEIKESTGISLDTWTPTKQIIRKLNAAKSLDIISMNMRSMERAAKGILADAQEMYAAVSEMNLDRQKSLLELGESV